MILQAGIGTSTLGVFNTALTVKCLTDLSRESFYYGDLQHIDKLKSIRDGNYTLQHIEPPASKLEKRKNECGIPFWPYGFVKVRCDIDELLQAWNNEYACLGYGAHLAQFLERIIARYSNWHQGMLPVLWRNN